MKEGMVGLILIAIGIVLLAVILVVALPGLFSPGTGSVDTVHSTPAATSTPVPGSDTTPPLAVSALAAASEAQTYIDWSWTDPADEDLATVMVYLDGVFQENVSTGKGHFTAIGLEQGTGYIIGTRTVDLAGNVGPWRNASGTTTGVTDSTPPAGVSALVAYDIAEDYVMWTWTDPADSDFAYVRVYLDNAFRQNVQEGAQLYTATGLDAGTTYTLSTRAVDTLGNAGSWVNASGTTTGGDSVPPDSVSSLIADTITENQIMWTWTDPADSDLAYVRVYLDNDFRKNVQKGTEYYTATVLNPGTEYIISTRTFDISGNAGPWMNATATTGVEVDSTPPAGVSGLVEHIISQTYIKWIWTDPDDEDLDGVNVHINGAFIEKVAVGTEFYTATGLIAGTTYTISTRTVDETGNNGPWINYSTSTAP